MKLLILPDPHGKTPIIPKKIIAEVDIIVCPGDFCAHEHLMKIFMKSVKKVVDGKGYIPFYEQIGKREAKKEVLKSIRTGREVLKWLNNLGKPVITIPGNWDWIGRHDPWEFLNRNYFEKNIQGLKNIHTIHQKKKTIKGLTFVGNGISGYPEVPQTKKEQSVYGQANMKYFVKELGKDTKKVVSLIRKSKHPVILLSHNMPYGSKFDVVKNKLSPKNGMHVGSLLARDVIKQTKPILMIGGHMHEHFGKSTMNKIPIICAGYGRRKYILVDIEKEKVKNIHIKA